MYKDNVLKILRIGFVIGFAWLFAACGSAQPAPTATPQLSLPGSYTSVTGALTLNYPSGWVVEEQAGLVGIANSPRAMNATIEQRAMEAGQIGAIITPLSAETLALMVEQNDWGSVPSPSGFMAFIASTITTGTLGDITEATLNGRNAAYVTLILEDGDTLAIVVDASGGAYALLQAAMGTGDLAQFQDTLLAIAGTITFTPAS